MALDYQWPSAARLPARFRARGADPRRVERLMRGIEEIFESRLGVRAVLVPSARAGLAMILRAHSVDRSRVVHVPQWVSHCLWDVVGRYSNTSVSFEPRPDVVLAVHKWGVVSRLSHPTKALVIEDSVDSLPTSPRSLFPNGGLYELISLPKVFGAFCGGVVLTRDASAAERLRALRKREELPLRPTPSRTACAVPAAGRAGARALAGQQSMLKYLAAKAAFDGRTEFMEWEYLEFENLLLDEASLEHVADCVAGWDECAATILSRLERAVAADRRLGRGLNVDQGRLPPLLAITGVEPAAAAKAGFLVRRVDVRRSVDRPDYRPAALLPLHFGVREAEFGRLLGALTRLRR